MKKNYDFIIRVNEPLNKQNHLLKVSPVSDELLPKMYPGQFVQILVNGACETFLRRPISINFVDTANNEMWLLVQRVGRGTNTICDLQTNEKLNILFPLGNTFSIPSNPHKKLLLIGGGVGVAPLLFLGKILRDRGFYPNFLLGGRSAKDLLQFELFEQYGAIFCTTEDGSKGERGFVTHHPILQNSHYDMIYTCGPKPMMEAVARYAHEQNITCEVSLENLMACGFGACLCCIEKTVKGNVCACTEGPVFNIKELTWNV